jgi:hypothetical protein
MAVAIASSVTVSMLAEMMGSSRVKSPTSRLRRETSLRERTEERFGTIKTSSKVSP